jgi:hypothetical protein
MWPFKTPEPAISRDAWNQLLTRVHELEAANSERQLAVLSTVEKVLYQLRARTAKRAKEGVEPPQDAPDGVELSDTAPRPPSSTAHLSRRFRSI